jgi:hypothetical protein
LHPDTASGQGASPPAPTVLTCAAETLPVGHALAGEAVLDVLRLYGVVLSVR